MRTSRRAGLAIASIGLAVVSCYAGGAITEEWSEASHRDLQLVGGAVLRVRSFVSHQHVEATRGGFGCFGAPYGRLQWEDGRAASDFYLANLAVAPGDQTAAVTVDDALRFASAGEGGTDRAAVVAAADAVALTACADASGRFAVVAGAGGTDFVIVGLERASTMGCHVDLSEAETRALVPDAVLNAGDAQLCAWIAENRDDLLAACGHR